MKIKTYQNALLKKYTFLLNKQKENKNIILFKLCLTRQTFSTNFFKKLTTKKLDR